MDNKGSRPKTGSRERRPSGGVPRPKASPRGESSGYNWEKKRARVVQSSAQRQAAKTRNTIYVVVGVLAAVVLGFFVMQNLSGGASADSGAGVRRSAGTFTTVVPENGQVRLAKAQFDNGKARFYTYKTPQGKEIDFFALKGSDGVVRAAMDNCDVCPGPRKGYHQEGDEIVCNNCPDRYPSVKIATVTSGCNPAALAHGFDGADLVIAAADIVKGNVDQKGTPLF